MRRGILKVTPELICERLQLPVGTVIEGASWDLVGRAVMFDVRHPDLPETHPREMAQIVTPEANIRWRA